MISWQYNIKKIEFFDALEYALEILNNEKSLSKSLSCHWNFNKGIFYSLLPVNIDGKKINFKYGFNMWKNVTDPWLVNLLFDEIKKGHTCLFQCYLAQKSDPFIKMKNGFTFKDDEVYIVLKNGSKFQIKQALMVASSGFIDIAMASKSTDLDFDNHAKECTLLSFGAFDGEGYLVWLLSE